LHPSFGTAGGFIACRFLSGITVFRLRPEGGQKQETVYPVGKM
jgi:hypothetical protein